LDYSLEKWLKLFLDMAWRIWIIWIILGSGPKGDNLGS
jgi:hypothetical protein